MLKTSELSDTLKGKIYAVLGYPFEQVYSSINNPNHWCNVSILHINVKYCNTVKSNVGIVLNINLGKKYD